MTPHTSGAADLPEALRLAAELDHGYPLVEDAQAAAAELRRLHALAAGQAVAPVTRIPLATGGELCFEPYVIGSAKWLWALRRDKEFIRYLDSFEQEFVNAAVRAARPAPPAMDGGDAARLDWIAMHRSFGVDSASGEVGGNGQKRLAATRRNIDAARAAEKEGDPT